MAGTYDSEKQRVIDRIMSIAFCQVRDAGATFINRNWIAQKLHRSIGWVCDNWNKNHQDCFTEFWQGRPLQMSQENRNIVAESSHKQQKGNGKVAQEILIRWNKSVSFMTSSRHRASEGLKPFHNTYLQAKRGEKAKQFTPTHWEENK
uniref:Transposase n=1 Tax=Romanomermis culicivorax TaxID=13658 RepID=A0A915HXC1_ROMCU